jgi:hypothetical protein
MRTMRTMCSAQCHVDPSMQMPLAKTARNRPEYKADSFRLLAFYAELTLWQTPADFGISDLA